MLMYEKVDMMYMNIHMRYSSNEDVMMKLQCYEIT